MVKRREPSGGRQERGQGTRWKEDTATIRDHTLQLLWAGARTNAAADEGRDDVKRHNPVTASHHPDPSQTVFVTGPTNDVIDIANPARLPSEVKVPDDGNACADVDMSEACPTCWRSYETFCTHCEEPLCCGRACECHSCQEPFCEQCSVTNYDERYDRTFCLECNGTDSRRASHEGTRHEVSTSDHRRWT